MISIPVGRILGDPMTIQLNGEPRTLEEAVTVGALLRSLNLQNDKVAVEVNLEILDKQDFEIDK